MISIKKSVLKMLLRYEIVSDIPGRLRLKFALPKKYTKEIEAYKHYIGAALGLLKGIESVQVNEITCSLLVVYNKEHLQSKKIIKWISIIMDEGIHNLELITQNLEDLELLEEISKEKLLYRLQDL